MSNSFYFMNEEVSLLKLPDTENWYLINTKDHSYSLLKLLNENAQTINGNNIEVKTFENAELRYDKDFGKFQHDQNGFILLNCCHQIIPSELIDLIKT